MSSLTINHDHRPISPSIVSAPVSSGSEKSQMQRLSGSTARDVSFGLSSLASTDSTTTSVVRTEQSRRTSSPRDTSHSPNPLRNPVLALSRLDGQRRRSSSQYYSGGSLSNETPRPALASATLRCIPDVTSTDLESAIAVWIAVDVHCAVHYAEHPSSSPRSRALGPPHTDPGFLSNLSINIIPAKHCNVLRTVGSVTREILLPSDSWGVVIKVLADAPVQKKIPRAFNLQNRPHSHTLMDQLHTMMSPSAMASPQDLVRVDLTFDQVLLPSSVHCYVDECLSFTRSPNRRSGIGTLPLRRPHNGRGSSPSHGKALAIQQRDTVASRLLEVLCSMTLSSASEGALLCGLSGPREAAEILEDFFRHSKVSIGLQQRAGELLSSLHSASRRATSRGSNISSRRNCPASTRRRNGLELARSNLQLQNITNQPERPHSAAPRSVHKRRGPSHGRESTTVAAKQESTTQDAFSTAPMPAPLFSPRKRPSVAKLGVPASSRDRGENWDPKVCTVRSGTPGLAGSFSPPNGGGPTLGFNSESSVDGEKRHERSLRYYEDEVDEASRIWRSMRRESGGGVTAGLGAGARVNSTRDMSNAATTDTSISTNVSCTDNGAHGEEQAGKKEDEFANDGDEEIAVRGVLGAPWM